MNPDRKYIQDHELFIEQITPEESECFIEILPEQIEDIQKLERHHLNLTFLGKAEILLGELTEDWQFRQYMVAKRLLKQLGGLKLAVSII